MFLFSIMYATMDGWIDRFIINIGLKLLITKLNQSEKNSMQ